MTANEHFERIFEHTLRDEIHRIMFVAGYEAALGELMDRSKNSNLSAHNLALAMYSESVIEDVRKLKNAKKENNEISV